MPYDLPGVRLKPDFFTCPGTNIPTYPSAEVFADYESLDIGAGSLAMYSVNPMPNPIAPVTVGFVQSASDHCPISSFWSYHTFQTAVADGDSWTSPVVRVVIGQSAAATALSYRHDNRIDAYPSVAAKLGSRFNTFARAPLIKADAAAINEPFSQWSNDLQLLPSPAIIHPVAYEPIGFDHSYPDFLPPNRAWGTQADFKAMVQAAQRRGH